MAAGHTWTSPIVCVSDYGAYLHRSMQVRFVWWLCCEHTALLCYSPGLFHLCSCRCSTISLGVWPVSSSRVKRFPVGTFFCFTGSEVLVVHNSLDTLDFRSFRSSITSHVCGGEGVFCLQLFCSLWSSLWFWGIRVLWVWRAVVMPSC